jgi:hypothetical protein
MSSATVLSITYSTQSKQCSTAMKIRMKPSYYPDKLDYKKMAQDFLFEMNFMGVEGIERFLKAMKIEETFFQKEEEDD